jgi:hypothetical protein
MAKNPGRKPLRDADIEAFLKRNPDAQYQEMLDAFHRAGFRVNRHGSAEILGRYQRAKEKIR